jgi:hypothetical protein
MPNKHIEHPEDSILSGDLRVLRWFTEDGNISVKIDGSPAIVWGTNPATKKFFVGTKSVFNKKLIKINHSHKEIDKNHTGFVAKVLHACFDNLPKSKKVYQGDFIGFGGDYIYRPNTITYRFDKIIKQNIIIAPHTLYHVKQDLKDAIGVPIHKLPISRYKTRVKFVRPLAEIHNDNESIRSKCNFARQMATLCKFPTKSSVVNNIKKQLNACIREGLEVTDLIQEGIAITNKVDVNVIRLWKLIESIKLELFHYILVEDSIGCEIAGHDVDHEGYVLENKFGTFKIVDREVFSYHNFNISKNRK